MLWALPKINSTSILKYLFWQVTGVQIFTQPVDIFTIYTSKSSLFHDTYLLLFFQVGAFLQFEQ